MEDRKWNYVQSSWYVIVIAYFDVLVQLTNVKPLSIRFLFRAVTLNKSTEIPYDIFSNYRPDFYSKFRPNRGGVYWVSALIRHKLNEHLTIKELCKCMKPEIAGAEKKLFSCNL